MFKIYLSCVCIYIFNKKKNILNNFCYFDSPLLYLHYYHSNDCLLSNSYKNIEYDFKNLSLFVYYLRLRCISFYEDLLQIVYR